jgi:hypothetical protein
VCFEGLCSRKWLANQGSGCFEKAYAEIEIEIEKLCRSKACFVFLFNFFAKNAGFKASFKLKNNEKGVMLNVA